jgi:transposase
MNHRTIDRWLGACHYLGQKSLKAKRIAGAPLKRSARQMAKPSRIIRQQNPLQLKFELSL